MNKKIAILRGINVGGKRKLLMADLKSLCEELGWQEVKTYIQSGNLIFRSSEKNPELENRLEEAIASKFGYEVPVIVRGAEEVHKLNARNPFYDAEADVSKLHLSFLKEKPSEEKLAEIEQYSFEPDRFVVEKKEVFIYCEGKYHKTKISNNFLEKKLQVGATTRNWKTILKLIELSKS